MNAVDTKRFHPDPQLRQEFKDKYGISHDQHVVLFAGRLEEIKNVGSLIEAINILRQGSQDVRLFLAGDGTLRTRL